MLISLSACEGLGFKKEPVPEAVPAPPPVVVTPSSAAIRNVSDADIQFAQSALNQLGYKLGLVDGIWGPRSAKAIRNFERKQGLKSANGHLSELNLFSLEKLSKVNRRSVAKAKVVSRKGLSAKVDNSVPLSAAPQLVIIDRPYSILAKPNPYSENLANLLEGTGLYIISLQEGWYEVESENKVRGYIKAN